MNLKAYSLVRLAAVFISNVSITTFLFPSLTINLFADLIIYGSSLFIEANISIYLFIYLFTYFIFIYLLRSKIKENRKVNCGQNREA